MIPTDGSELAIKAVAHGAKLAGHVGASAVIVTEIWSALEIAAEVEEGQQNRIEMCETVAETAASENLEIATKLAEAECC